MKVTKQTATVQVLQMRIIRVLFIRLGSLHKWLKKAEAADRPALLLPSLYPYFISK